MWCLHVCVGGGGGVKIFLCTSSTQIYRLLLEAFRGVGENSSHSFTRQFPIATTCFVLFHDDILVLFISLHFYWTRKGVLQCFIIPLIPLLYFRTQSIKSITLNDCDGLSLSQTDQRQQGWCLWPFGLRHSPIGTWAVSRPSSVLLHIMFTCMYTFLVRLWLSERAATGAVIIHHVASLIA